MIHISNRQLESQELSARPVSVEQHLVSARRLRRAVEKAGASALLHLGLGEGWVWRQVANNI